MLNHGLPCLSKRPFAGVDPAATGRPAYHPADLLKIYIYSYLNGIQSSRRLEREFLQSANQARSYILLLDDRSDCSVWLVCATVLLTVYWDI